MRILLLTALGVSGAMALGVYVSGKTEILGLVLLFGFLGLKWKKTRAASLILGSMGLGFLWFSLWSGIYLEPIRNLPEEPETVTVTVIQAREGENSVTAQGWIRLEGRPYRMRLYLNPEEPVPDPGEVLRGEFRLRAFLPWEQGSRTYDSGQSFFLRAYQKGDLLRSRDPQSLSGLPGRIRNGIKTSLNRFFPADAAPFAGALLLGDTEDLTPETDWDLRLGGIRHVAAVSGLHVSILCMLLSVLTGRRGWLTFLLSLPALGLFCAVTGFTPSVVRASLMMALFLLAGVIRRGYDGLTGLAFAVLVMLFLNPMVITALSFQLSVGSVLGILLFYGKLYSLLIRPFAHRTGMVRKLAAFVCSSGAVSLSALVFVTPLCALRFGCVSLVGPLTNLLTIWAVALIFWGILGVLGLGLIFPIGARILAFPVTLLIRWVLGVTHVLARLPLAAVFTVSPWICLWLALSYILGLVLLTGKRKYPGIFGAVTALTLSLALAVSWLGPQRDSLRIRMLDVGQGQCILLQSQGRAFLVDCGGGKPGIAADKASMTLLSQGISRLDGLILTHFDRDHVGDAETLLTRISADRIYVPAGRDLPFDSRLFTVDGKLSLQFGEGYLTIFGGGDPGIENENSLCVLFGAENYDILITGDRSIYGENLLLSEFAIPSAEVLVAGHHGAEDSTGPELLDRVRPETVLISAGKHNPYGHPAPETLLRLRDRGCRILRTDQQGDILIRR